MVISEWFDKKFKRLRFSRFERLLEGQRSVSEGKIGIDTVHVTVMGHFVNFCREFTVITSYSIHYTKLYELLGADLAV